MKPKAPSSLLVERMASPPDWTVRLAFSAVRESFPVMPWFAAVTERVLSRMVRVSLPVIPFL